MGKCDGARLVGRSGSRYSHASWPRTGRRTPRTPRRGGKGSRLEMGSRLVAFSNCGQFGRGNTTSRVPLLKYRTYFICPKNLFGQSRGNSREYLLGEIQGNSGCLALNMNWVEFLGDLFRRSARLFLFRAFGASKGLSAHSHWSRMSALRIFLSFLTWKRLFYLFGLFGNNLQKRLVKEGSSGHFQGPFFVDFAVILTSQGYLKNNKPLEILAVSLRAPSLKKWQSRPSEFQSRPSQKFRKGVSHARDWGLFFAVPFFLCHLRRRGTYFWRTFLGSFWGSVCRHPPPASPFSKPLTFRIPTRNRGFVGGPGLKRSNFQSQRAILNVSRAELKVTHLRWRSPICGFLQTLRGREETDSPKHPFGQPFVHTTPSPLLWRALRFSSYFSLVCGERGSLARFGT